MPRELRPRKSRMSYAQPAGYESPPEAGPSGVQITDDEASRSRFAPRDTPTRNDDDDDDTNDDSDFEMDVDEPAALAPKSNTTTRPTTSTPSMNETLLSFSPSKRRKLAATTRPSMSKPLQNITGALIPPPQVPATRTSKTYALPNPSAHHRHRAIPVYHHKEDVERLEHPPVLFKAPKTVFTKSMTASQGLTDRIGKAWGYSVGSGPVWEMLEDRSWFKESTWLKGDPRKECSRRPRVYSRLSVRPGWEVLDYRDARIYLPMDTTTTDEGGLRPPPPVACYMGPYGEQTRVLFAMFDSHATSEYFEGGKSYVFNAGSPVWGVDWCPIHTDDRPFRQFKQYLAIAPFPSRIHAPCIGAKAQYPAPACVQIWALRPCAQEESVRDDIEKAGEVKCEMVLCLDSGPAQEVKWCPLPSHDRWDISRHVDTPRKLGVLAGTFEDGSLSIYIVPDPADISHTRQDPSLPVFAKLPVPALRIELEGTSCWSFDWANSEVLAVGCTNGYIAVYDVGDALSRGIGPNILPTHFISVHQSAIRAVTWIRVPPTSSNGVPATSADPTVIASGGYDGVECLTDIREPHGHVINRTRDVINTASYSVFAAGPIMIDHDNTVKAYSVSPGMLGRGHILMEPDGPVWSVDASDHHPQLAVGSADGSCSTTNLLKSTRRGGLPFFVHKVYQMDFSRKTGEFRMLERFLPHVTQEKGPGAKAKAKARAAEEDDDIASSNHSTGVWPPEIGVHRVAWNSGNGLGCASLLASGTASGLCRVDWLPGRWFRDKVPYVNVPNMRKEVEVDGDVDSVEE
ncbi:hypothetical protein J3A83DRAFT_3825037 [Scleroderma citrinum]